MATDGYWMFGKYYDGGFTESESSIRNRTNKEKALSGEFITLFREKGHSRWAMSATPKNLRWLDSHEYKVIHKDYAELVEDIIQGTPVRVFNTTNVEIVEELDFLNNYDEDNSYGYYYIEDVLDITEFSSIILPETYPYFIEYNNGDIYKVINEGSYITMLSSERYRIGFNIDLVKSCITRVVPHCSETGYYDKQPIWCWDDEFEAGRDLMFFDAESKYVDGGICVFSYQGKRTGYGYSLTSPVTTEQLQTLPFIKDMYDKLGE